METISSAPFTVVDYPFLGETTFLDKYGSRMGQLLNPVDIPQYPSESMSFRWWHLPHDRHSFMNTPTQLYVYKPADGHVYKVWRYENNVYLGFWFNITPEKMITFMLKLED